MVAEVTVVVDPSAKVLKNTAKNTANKSKDPDVRTFVSHWVLS
jgi:hypothetical protein